MLRLYTTIEGRQISRVNAPVYNHHRRQSFRLLPLFQLNCTKFLQSCTENAKSVVIFIFFAPHILYAHPTMGGGPPPGSLHKCAILANCGMKEISPPWDGLVEGPCHVVAKVEGSTMGTSIANQGFIMHPNLLKSPRFLILCIMNTRLA